MQSLRLALFLAIAAASTGCLRMSFIVNVKPDGSGTIVQTVAFSKAALASAGAALAAAMEVKDAPAGGMGSIPMLDEAKVKAAAAEMGARFVSLQQLTEDGFEGQRATIAFDDINKLSMSMAAMFGAMSNFGGDTRGRGAIGVRLTRENGRSVLVLTMPEVGEQEAARRVSEAAEKGESAAGGINAADVPPEVAKMMRDMFEGMSMEAAINVEGAIVSTNAPYVDGSKVTLVSMDFTELMKNMKGLEEMMGQMKNFETLPASFGEGPLFPGMKVVMNREIRIEFR